MNPWNQKHRFSSLRLPEMNHDSLKSIGVILNMIWVYLIQIYMSLIWKKKKKKVKVNCDFLNVTSLLILE